MIKQISSIQNPLMKQILLLKSKSRERRKTGLFIVEGEREISLAVKGGYDFAAIVYCKEIYSENVLIHVLNQPVDRIEVPMDVYRKLAYRETTEGIIAIVKEKKHNLEDLKFTGTNPLILIAEAPEKPGNIGALLRTADAANLDAVIIADTKTDFYNPNTIRNSVGCLFTNQVATGTTDEIIEFLKNKNIAIYCATLEASVPYTEVDYTKGSAIVMGTESTGLSKKWIENATKNIIIPMEGEIDSMNVSVAAAIIIYEAKRQRK